MFIVPYVTSHPKNVYTTAGTTVKFSITATGIGPLTYTWQFTKDGYSYWYDIDMDGFNSPEFPVTASANIDGIYLRCVVTDAYGLKAYSNAAKLTVQY